MISFRGLTCDDCDFIMQNWVGSSVVFGNSLCMDDLLSIIQAFSQKKHNGNYFEVFGIVFNDVLVGTFSLYQIDESDRKALSLGIEIDKYNRRKGFASIAIKKAEELAANMGKSKLISQARVNNTACVGLHAKCGFEIVNKSVGKNGQEIYNYQKIL